MKGTEIKEKYPKSYTKLCEFIIEKLKESQKLGVPKGVEIELPEIPLSFAERAMDGLLLGNLRILYDFLDENDVEVFVCPGPDLNFTFSINRKPFEEYFNNRMNCEVEAFTFGLETLEEKLNG